MTKRKFNDDHNCVKSKKLRLAKPVPCKKLIDLPTEVLQQIIGGMSLQHQNSIRGTCKRLKEVTDGLIWIKVQVALQQFKKDPVKYQHHNALQVLHLITRPYQNAGFFCLFLRLAQLLMRGDYSCRYYAPQFQLRFYLLSFFGEIDERFTNPYSQVSRMLYVTTLLGILQNASICTRVKEKYTETRQLQLSYNVNGFMKMLNREQFPELEFSIDKNTVFLALAEILVNSGTPFRRSYWTSQSTLIVGNDDELEILPKITFNFLIHGTESVLEYFRNIPNELEELPTDPFNVVLQIVCHEIPIVPPIGYM